MKGMEINVGRRFVQGSFDRGSDVDQTGMKQAFRFLSAKVVTPPNTLALFDHSTQKHVSTGVTDTQFDTLQRLNLTDQPKLTHTHQQQIADILASVNIDTSNLNQRQKLEAAVLLGSNMVNAAWLADNTEAIRTGNKTALRAGQILHQSYLFAHAQQLGGLQSPSDSLHTRLALEIANEVVGPNGTINQEKLAEMQTQIRNDQLAVSLKAGPHHKAMVKTLGWFGGSSALRIKLNGIQAPQPGTPQERLLRATLGKSTGQINNRDARVAVLSAMLADLRQGQVGSCFGTSIAIHIKNNLPDKMLTHLKDMVEHGRIRGSYQRDNLSPTVPLDLPMNTSVQDSQISQIMKVNANGQMTHLNQRGVGSPKSVGDIPGMRSALLAIGIVISEDQNKAILDAITRLRGQDQTVDVTPKQILDDIVDNSQSIQLNQKPAMKAKAADRFHADMENRLLRAFEYTVSGFAETHFASPSLQAFATRLNDSFLMGGFPIKLNEEAQKIKNSTARDLFGNFAGGFAVRLNQTMDQHLVLQYDATLKHRQISDDGNSKFGGFSVFLKDPDSGVLSPVTNKQQLRTALEKLFAHQKKLDLETIKSMGQQAGTVRDHYNTFTSELGKILARGQSPEDTFMDNLLQGIDNLQEVPLGFPRGANPFDVMRLMFGIDHTPQVDSLPKGNRQPDDGRAVLKQMVTTMRGIHTKISNVSNGYSETQLEKMTIPCSNAPHAFLLTAGLDDKLKTVCKNTENIDTWMEKTLRPQKLKTFETTNLDTTAVRNAVSRLPRNLNINVGTVMSQLKSKGSTKPKDVLAIVFNNVTQGKKTEHVKEQIGQALAELLAAPVEPILVADSNWGDGEAHLYFGMVHNPFSGKTEMWNFEDNGQGIKPRSLPDQTKFLASEWTIAKEPKDFGF